MNVILLWLSLYIPSDSVGRSRLGAHGEINNLESTSIDSRSRLAETSGDPCRTTKHLIFDKFFHMPRVILRSKWCLVNFHHH
jgi:hypothetical protein